MSSSLLRCRSARRRASRSGHACCTRLTNSLLSLTTSPWSRSWLAPNKLTHERAFASDDAAVAPAAVATEAEANSHDDHDAERSPLLHASSQYRPHRPSSSTSSSPRRVRHVLVTIHGYLGMPRPFFLFRAPAVKSADKHAPSSLM
jgi:hypothetical protein